MPSKVVKSRVKTKLPLKTGYTEQFQKDWQELQHSGKCNMERLKGIMLKLIANDGPLDAIHLEHELLGSWAGFLECHMGGDVLLIYDRSATKIVFTRAGSHAKIFEN